MKSPVATTMVSIMFISKIFYSLFEPIIHHDEFRSLITGSARLDLLGKSGDSLIGRYNLFHMLQLH